MGRDLDDPEDEQDAVRGPEPSETGGHPFRVDVLTLFPDMFAGPLSESILRRAQERGLIEIAIHDIRNWTTDRHRTADDTPYGGGAGMVMLAPPIIEGVEAILGNELPEARVILLSAAGRRFDQAVAHELAGARRLVMICGHYEGVDERAVEILGAELLSIGDYVLTGGELPAMVVIDAVARLLPGVIDAASVAEESHDDGLVEYPHFTRPPVVRGLAVPDVLVSGHHAKIAAWRREQAIRRTARWRPDLLEGADLTPAERAIAEAEVREVQERRGPPGVDVRRSDGG